jgi:hypothetical protein
MTNISIKLKCSTPSLVLFTEFSQDDQVKVGEIDRACSTHGAENKAYRVLVGKPEKNQ